MSVLTVEKIRGYIVDNKDIDIGADLSSESKKKICINYLLCKVSQLREDIKFNNNRAERLQNEKVSAMKNDIILKCAEIVGHDGSMKIYNHFKIIGGKNA